jgi:energy-converting hydrogenase Eha subunit H
MKSNIFKKIVASLSVFFVAALVFASTGTLNDASFKTLKTGKTNTSNVFGG